MISVNGMECARYLRFARLDLGVEELGEARVVCHVLEVGVGAGLDTISRVETDSLGEVLEACMGISGHAGQDGEAIKGDSRHWHSRRGSFSTECARLRSFRR